MKPDPVTKPWGTEYHFGGMALGHGECRFKVLRLEPGQCTSLQWHAHRDEWMTVLEGRGIIYHAGGETALIWPTVVWIPKNEPHRLEAAQNSALVVAEVQFGERCDDGDIERLEDAYGRAQSEDADR